MGYTENGNESHFQWGKRGTVMKLYFSFFCICDIKNHAREARIDAPGVLNHIICRGIERRKIFQDDVDRKILC